MRARYSNFAINLLLLIVSFESPHVTFGQESQSRAGTTDISGLQARADAGDAKAQLRLSQAYEKGDGVVQDAQAAFQWCRKAADQGDAAAENRVGEMYRAGEGVAQDKAEAVRWYCKAARLGSADAMCNLGVAFYNGDGVDVNDSLSYAWFLLAKDAGCTRASEAVQRAESEISPMKMTVAYGEIAKLYEANRCLSSNTKDEVRWLTKAAERGDEDSQVGLAIMLLEGKGVAQDFKGGQHWCKEALKKNPALGGYCTGYMYEKGLGVPQDAGKARRYYQEAVALGSIAAIRAVARMDVQGEGGKIDRVGACVLYARLAARGDKDALEHLTQLKAEMSPKDWQKACKLMAPLRVDLNALVASPGKTSTRSN